MMNDDDGSKFVCKKCGEKFYVMPTSHGHLYSNIYPNKPRPSVECGGEVVAIPEDEER